jgi:hypothetical protein
MKAEQPYRPVPSKLEPEADLERLAAQGRQLAAGQRALSQKNTEREIQARLLSAMELLPAPPRSLGALLDTWIPRTFFALGGLALALSLVPDDSTISGDLRAGGFGALAVGAVWLFLPLVLSSRLARNGVMHRLRDRALLAAERAWPSSLPFALEGYLEILGQEPMSCSIEAAITLQPGSRTPGLDVLQGLVLGIEVDAKVVNVGGGASSTITIRSASKGDMAGSVYVVSNREIPPYVHALVEKVLLPLHRTHPIERVSLSRVLGLA